jgi:hypothetical protein
MIKNIGDNYWIYSLKIIKTAKKKSLVLEYGLSNAIFEPLNHVFAFQNLKIFLQIVFKTN